MYLLGIGIVLLLLKYLEIAPVAAWSWWVILSPFGLAVAWWAWADSTGYTKRKVVEREEALKATPRQNVFDPANFINIGIILRVFLEASQGL